MAFPCRADGGEITALTAGDGMGTVDSDSAFNSEPWFSNPLGKGIREDKREPGCEARRT